MKADQQIEERFQLTPEFIRFDQPGQVIEGVYIHTDTVDMRTGEGTVAKRQYYLLDRPNRCVWKFNGTTQLIREFALIKTGARVQVEFIEEIRTSANHPFKVFKVGLVGASAQAILDGLERGALGSETTHKALPPQGVDPTTGEILEPEPKDEDEERIRFGDGLPF